MTALASRHAPAAAASSTDELHRSAFNAAFHELGLRWFWDRDTYQAMAAEPCERARIRDHLSSDHAHLLRAYDPEFLADAILTAKQRHLGAMHACAPQSAPQINWSCTRWGEVGV